MPLPILPSAIDLSPFCCEILPLRISPRPLRPPPSKESQEASGRCIISLSLSLSLAHERRRSLAVPHKRCASLLVAYQLFPMHLAVMSEFFETTESSFLITSMIILSRCDYFCFTHCATVFMTGWQGEICIFCIDIIDRTVIGKRGNVCAILTLSLDILVSIVMCENS